ncbi:hypothetical protein L1987_74194 [Smallanthus sonchifolius]|uniref:Uncharacterized protein n=1 Tax=Smallanthus sonchifolius TaxID=185202 RepID=A0ACB9A298_9ASTR|nr:hypothetical protein L1987_74194 [Smallanthus sonchifolius]
MFTTRTLIIPVDCLDVPVLALLFPVFLLLPDCFGSSYQLPPISACSMGDEKNSQTRACTFTRKEVRLIGYCVKRSLFLVYEYIENGNLSKYLHGSDQDATHCHGLPESKLPLIHQGVLSISMNIRSPYMYIVILNQKIYSSTRTFMGRYAQYGDVSPKVDVYAFGVVLYELISAKKALIRANGALGEPKGLVAMFDEVLNQAYPKDDLVKMIDPRLGDNYPLDSVHKMAQLAKACTHADLQRRPSMRSIVVALMTLSTSTED